MIMNTLAKATYGFVLGAVLLCGLPAVQAAVVTYNFSILGDVSFGDGSGSAFGLNTGETITATGTFTADLGTIGSETGTVAFGSGSGNTMSIDLNGTIFTASDDDRFGAGAKPSLTFSSGSLTDFDFLKDPGFSSNFMFFDNLDSSTLFGEWQTNANLTVVPLPAALWLFGSGLLGLVGIVRRRT
jgi:hypothetical protein